MSEEARWIQLKPDFRGWPGERNRVKWDKPYQIEDLKIKRGGDYLASFTNQA